MLRAGVSLRHSETMIHERRDVVTYNRHGVGSFTLDPAMLPAGLPLDRYGCYDSFILNGNGSAQTHKRGGRCYITFNIDPEVEYHA